MRTYRFRPITALALMTLSLALLATAALAFDNPLSSSAIRDAYFLATGNPDKRAEFFDKYTRHPPKPKIGPAIASIQIQTPFAAVVQDIADRSLNVRAPDAVKQYYGKPAQFRVRVVIDFTATYPPSASTSMQLGSFWNKFHVHLRQGEEIPSRSVQGKPILSTETPSGYIGAIIVANYDPNKIESGPATIVVTGPDDARAETTFDLGALR
jgi:hypothetical protein